MSITNQSRPNSSVINSAKVATGETWATIETTYATETRTWLDMASLLINTNRVSSSITNVTKPS